MKEIIIATKNQGKVNEFKDMFQDSLVHVQSLLDLSVEVPDIEETGKTFQENAEIKAESVSKWFNKPVIADDSGLVVDALNGAPGVYSARYAGENKTDEEHYMKLLESLKDVPFQDRTARFICVLAFKEPEKKAVFFTGICEGKIAFEPLGNEGFGYDPVFIPEGDTRTMAQLLPEEKNRLSHRSEAIKEFAKWMNQYMRSNGEI